MKRLWILGLMAVVSCWMVAHPALGSKQPVGVVTSVLPLAFLVGEVGGERVKVDALVPPGASPHTFEPVPSDMVKLQQARYFVSVGGGFDGWFDKLLGAASGALERVTLIAAPNLKPLEADHHHHHGHGHEREHAKEQAEAHRDHGHGHAEEKHGHAEAGHGHEREHAKEHAEAHREHGHGHAKAEHGHEREHAKERAESHRGHGHEHAEAKHGHGEEPHEKGHGHEEGHASEEMEGLDPHFWLDPIRVRDAVLPVLVEHLIEADPAGGEYYRKRAEDFRQRLTALDAEIRQQLAMADGRQFVSFHRAWAYFAERYDIEEVDAVQEFAGEEPTPAEVARLVRGARAAGVRNIMVEPQLDPRVARTIAGEFGAGTVLVDPLGDSGDPARSTYEGLMRFNARAFGRALGGAGN